MSEARIAFSADGTVSDMTNFLISPDGGFTRLSLPVNAVLVQVFRGVDDEDGNPTYQTATSLVCVDDLMLPVLKGYAQKVLHGLTSAKL